MSSINLYNEIVLSNPDASLEKLQAEIKNELELGNDPFKSLDTLGEVVDNLIQQISSEIGIYVDLEPWTTIAIRGYNDEGIYTTYLKLELEDWIEKLYEIFFDSETVGEFVHNYTSYMDDITYQTFCYQIGKG